MNTAENTSGTAAAPPPPEGERRRARRLSSMANVKAALADVYRRQDAGKLNPNEARARVYTLQVLATVISGTDIEKRLLAVEEKLGQ